jgi:hypothetical protein
VERGAKIRFLKMFYILCPMGRFLPTYGLVFRRNSVYCYKVNHEMFMVKLYQNTNVKSVKSEISYR